MRFLKTILATCALVHATSAANAINIYASNDVELAVAISVASDGDVIKVAPGNYSPIVIRGGAFNQVAVGNNIILGGAPSLSSGVTIESMDPGNWANLKSINIQSSNYWNFSNFDIRPTAVGTNFTAVKIRGNNNSLQNSIVSYGNSANWTAQDWQNNAANGISVSGNNTLVRNNYIESTTGGIVFDHNSVNGKAIHNTFSGLAGDGAKALGDFTLLENNLFRNFKDVNSNHDDCVQSFSRDNGVIGAGSVVGVTLRGNLCISSVDQADPLYSGTQGYALFNGTAEDWVIENNILFSSVYHGIYLQAAINTVIDNNTIIDDSALINGANTDWIRLEGSNSNNLISDNISNRLVDNSGSTLTNNETINIAEYDLWFVDWRNHDFRLRDDAPRLGIGAIPSNAGAFFDLEMAIPVPGSLVMGLTGIVVLAGAARRHAQKTKSR